MSLNILQFNFYFSFFYLWIWSMINTWYRTIVYLLTVYDLRYIIVSISFQYDILSSESTLLSIQCRKPMLLVFRTHSDRYCEEHGLIFTRRILLTLLREKRILLYSKGCLTPKSNTSITLTCKWPKIMQWKKKHGFVPKTATMNMFMKVTLCTRIILFICTYMHLNKYNKMMSKLTAGGLGISLQRINLDFCYPKVIWTYFWTQLIIS